MTFIEGSLGKITHVFVFHLLGMLNQCNDKLIYEIYFIETWTSLLLLVCILAFQKQKTPNLKNVKRLAFLGNVYNICSLRLWISMHKHFKSGWD